MNPIVKYVLGLITAIALAMLISVLAAREAGALEPGQQYCREGVCVNKAQLLLFGETLFAVNAHTKTENAARLLTEKPALLRQLRDRFTDAELFVMWNNASARKYIQTETPAVWAIMAEIMQDLVRQHQYEPGRTYKLDY